MKRIRFTKEFLAKGCVKIMESSQGLELVFPDADFIVFLNQLDSLAISTFKGGIDDTLAIKDLLCDQIQYVDHIQRDPKSKKSLIDLKFKDAQGGPK